MQNENTLGNLLEKMKVEQAVFRERLLGMAPESILEEAYHYAVREDILAAMEDADLEEAQIGVLLEQESPLEVLYTAHTEDLGPGYMLGVQETAEEYTNRILAESPVQEAAPPGPQTSAEKDKALNAYISAHWYEPEGQQLFQRRAAIPDGDAAAIAILYDEVLMNQAVEQAVAEDVQKELDMEKAAQQEQKTGSPLLYRQTWEYAAAHGEQEEVLASMRENTACRNALDAFITKNYDGRSLKTEGLDDLIAQFGLERTAYVLANTIHCHNYDGRFSPANRNWARAVIEKPDNSFVLQSHSGLVDMLATDIRKAERAQGQPQTTAPHWDSGMER